MWSYAQREQPVASAPVAAPPGWSFESLVGNAALASEIPAAAPGTVQASSSESPWWSEESPGGGLGGTDGSHSVISPVGGESGEVARQEDWGNENVLAWEQELAAAGPIASHLPQPAKASLGSPAYYLERIADFARRNPGAPEPDYYRGYGWKYCVVFSEELYLSLSDAGQRWCIETRMNLQIAIERKLIADPAGFAALESDSDALREFAFDTHPIAYLEAGLADLPLTDLLQIAATPELGDLLTRAGIEQILVTAGAVASEWGAELATGQEVDLVF